MMLYKYLGVDRFYDVLENKQFVLVKPESWDDPYENLIIRFFFDDIKYENFYKKCKKYKDENPFRNSIQINQIIFLAWYVSKTNYCLCFTEEKSKNGKDEMWRSYSNNNFSIRIGYEFEMASYSDYFQNDINNQKSDVIGLGRIQYGKMDIDKMLDQVIKGKFLSPFFNKRRAFKYEKEVRLIKPKSLSDILLDIQADNINEKDFTSRKMFFQYINEKKELDFPENEKIEFYSHRVKSVLIHPLASRSTVFMANKLCEEFNLPTPKLSELYKSF